MRAGAVLLVVAILAVGCGGSSATDAAAPATQPVPTTVPAAITTSTAPTTTTPPPPTTSTTTTTTTTAPSPFARPDWLGTRLLPLRADDHGEVQPTPPELSDRRFATLPLLPPPADDTYVATIEPVPADVLDRSTWRPECPVTPDQLRYLTVTHWGFDGEHHTGELLVDASVADDVVQVFRRLHEVRFPIEQVRVTSQERLDAHPTGDDNETTSFVCRPAVGSTRWSAHALGLAIDINPFHNPYRRGDLVLPELASDYLDRERILPGMIVAGDPVVTAFADIGWTWGGTWSSLDDWMHFSATGR